VELGSEPCVDVIDAAGAGILYDNYLDALWADPDLFIVRKI
jgi:hypothetical protein